MSAVTIGVSTKQWPSDPDLARVVRAEAEQYSGRARERAEAAVRKVLASGLLGTHAELIEAYRNAITAAAKEK